MFFGKSTRGWLSAIAVFAATAVMAASASAAALTWDPALSGGTATGGSGTWATTTTAWFDGSENSAWVTGDDAAFGGTSGTATVSGGTVSANNLYFNTSGYSIAGASTLALTGGSVTVPGGDIATITAKLLSSPNLTLVGGGTLAVDGGLTTQTNSTINIANSGDLVLGGATGTTNLANGGVLNGNLIIAGPIRVNFNSVVGSTGAALPDVAVYSGSGAIQVQASGTILSNTSGTYGGAIGAAGGGLQIELNSLNLPFAKFNVAQSSPAYPPANSFVTAIGATKNGTFNGYLQINAPISGNSDVVFTSNSTTGGGAGITLLNAPCTYTGATLIEGNGGVTAGYTGGSLILGCSNALPAGTDVEFGDLNGKPSHTPEIDLNGFNQRIGSLSSNAASATYASTASFYIANNNAGTVATLTVSGATTPYNAYGGYLVDTSNPTGGTLALVKAGPNTLALSASNTFSGGTIISGGAVQLLGNLSPSSTAGPAIASPLGTGPVTVLAGGALAGSPAGGAVLGSVNVQSGGEILPGGITTSGLPLTLGSGLSMQGETALSFIYGSLTSTSSAQLEVSGALSLPLAANSVTVDLTPQRALSAVTPLFSFGSLTNGTASIASLELGNSASLPPGFTFQLDSSLGSLGSGNANQIDLYNPNITNPVSITWNATGASGAWNSNTSNTTWAATGGSSTSFQTNYAATFHDISGSTIGIVTISSSGVQPGSVTVSNSNTAYTFTGGAITGYTSIVTGTGMLTLAATNSYTGGTYVSGGTLVAAAGDGSLGNSTGALYLDNGATFVTTNSGITSTRSVSIATTGGSADTSAIFNTNGLNSTLNGAVTVGNASVSGTFTKVGAGALTLAGQTVLADGPSQTGAVLSAQAGNLQVAGQLSLGNYGSLNVGPSGTLTLAAANTTIDQNNGGIINGSLVIAQPMRLNFNDGIFSGTGQIQVATPSGAVITNAGSLPNQGYSGTIDTNIVLNSLGLPFAKTDVTQATLVTGGSNSFIVNIGGTKGSTIPLVLTIGGVISGNSDVNFSNSSGGGGSGNIQLNAQNTYTGATLIDFSGNITGGAQGGIIMLGVNDALPPSTDVVFGAIGGVATAWLDLEGFNQHIGSLSTVSGGTGANNYTITNQNLGTLSTLTVSGATTPYQPFAGTIADSFGLIALAKAGSNALVLTGPNNYSGGSTVTGGQLFIDNPNLGQTSTGLGNVAVSGGTFGGVGNVGDPDYSKGTPTISVSAGAALYVGMPTVGAAANTSGNLYVNGYLFAAAGSALDFDFGAGSASELLANSGLNLPSSGGVAINLTNVNGLTGTLPIVGFSSIANGSTSSLSIGGAPSGDSYSLSYDSMNNAIDLTIAPTSTAAVSLSGGTTAWGAVLATTPSTAVTISAAASTSSAMTLGMNRTVGSLVFNATNGAITLERGNILALGTSSALPTIRVNSGSVDIAAPAHLGGDLTISMSGGTSLEFGNIHEDTIGSSLTLQGSGQLVLGGSGSYTGGTVVEGGTLVVDNAYGLNDGSNLTVGNPAAFEPPVFAGEIAGAAGPSVTAVPEPGTLALLALGALVAGFGATRRRKRENE